MGCHLLIYEVLDPTPTLTMTHESERFQEIGLQIRTVPTRGEGALMMNMSNFQPVRKLCCVEQSQKYDPVAFPDRQTDLDRLVGTTFKY
jgi:hypothetical protein